MANETVVAPKTNPTPQVSAPPAVIDGPQKVLPETESKVEQVQKLTDVKNTTKTAETESLIPTDNYLTSPLWYEVVNYLGIPQEEWAGAKNEVSDIVDYVIREVNSNHPDEILVKLRELEDIIQKPTWGEKRYHVLYRYIRLAGKKQAISQAMSAFERKDGTVNGN